MKRCAQCGRRIQAERSVWCGDCELFWTFWCFIQGSVPEADPPYSRAMRRQADQAEAQRGTA